MSTRITCKVCRKKKTVPAKMQRGVHRTEFLLDPYCSRVCCELDHQIKQREHGTLMSGGRAA